MATPEDIQKGEPVESQDDVTSDEVMLDPNVLAQAAALEAGDESVEDSEITGPDITADGDDVEGVVQESIGDPDRSGSLREEPPAEDQSPPPPEDVGIFGEEDYGTNYSERQSSVTNNADTEIAAISDLDSVLEESAGGVATNAISGSSPVADSALAQSDDNNVSEVLSKPSKDVSELEAQMEEEEDFDDLLVPTSVTKRALPPEDSIAPTQRNLDSPREVSIDEHIPPAMAAAVQSMATADSSTAAASVDKSTAPSEPTKPAAPEMAAPVPTTQVPPSQTKQAPQGMPSLQARQPRPAGLGAGGLPPRPASARPSGMGGGLPPRPGAMGLRPPGNPPRPQMPNPLVHMVNPALNPPVEEPAEVQEARAKLMNIRLLMLRLASRLELPPIDLAVQEVMNKIDMAERLRFPTRAGPFRPQIDVLYNQAAQMDQGISSDSDLGINVTVLVIGPSGGGKTSIIRNLLYPGFGVKDSFAPGPTNKIAVYSGDVMGVHFTFIDTPGLSLSSTSMHKNMEILRRTKAAISRRKPDVVIYADRMDVFRRELTDVPLLRLVNEMLPEMLYSAVVMLTRGAAPPPDTADAAMEYMDYYRHRLDVCGQVVSHAMSDIRWGGRPMGFENHPNCPMENGAAILPLGIPFKKQALYHLLSSRMYGEVEKICSTGQTHGNTVSEMMRLMQPRRQLQLSALVSQLLTSKATKKYPEEERELKTEGELEKLDDQTRKIEESKRRDYVRMRRVEMCQEEQHPNQAPVVASSLELNPSFDHDVNQHRYRASDFVGGWSVRPIVSTPDGTFDHDDGIEMFQLGREGVLRPKKQCLGGCPANIIIQAGKGKNAVSVTADAGVSAYWGRSTVLTAHTFVHPAGQDGEFVYTPTVDMRFKTADRNKITMGLMACRLAESGWPHKGQLSYGAKIEDRVKIKEGVKLITALGLMTMKMNANQTRDLAYGANADLKLSGGKGEFDPNFILGVGMSTHQRGNTVRRAYSTQISAEKPLSHETLVSGRVSMNTGGTGQMTARMVTHDKPMWGWSIVVPLGIKLFKRLTGQSDDFA